MAPGSATAITRVRPGPLREGKGTCWEGGVRVPCIMRWPGKIPAGTTSDAMLMTIDLLPTIARLVGAELPKHPIDGLDVWPLLAGEAGRNQPARCLLVLLRTKRAPGGRQRRWPLEASASRTPTARSRGIPAAMAESR